MITINKTQKADIKDFLEREWIEADKMYYGKALDWHEEDYAFKAVENGEIVGTICGKIEQGILHISDLIVAQSERGKGVGSMLMEFIEDYAKTKNAHKSHLLTGKGWPTEEFYLKHGYKQIAILPNHYEHQDFIIFEKDL